MKASIPKEILSKTQELWDRADKKAFLVDFNYSAGRVSNLIYGRKKYMDVGVEKLINDLVWHHKIRRPRYRFMHPSHSTK